MLPIVIMYLIGQSTAGAGSWTTLPSARTASDTTWPDLPLRYWYKVTSPQRGRLAKKSLAGWNSPMVP
jgi:hypothetical protein